MKAFSTFSGIALALTVSAPANAMSLIGDDVTIRYLETAAMVEYVGSGFPVTVTGAAGTSDVVTDHFLASPFFSVDLEEESITVTFLRNTTFTAAGFDGLGFFGIDAPIASFVETSPFSNIVSQSGNTLYFNFNSVGTNSYRPGDTVVATLEFQVPAVPLPASASGMLAAFSVLGAFAVRRSRRA